MEQFSLHWNKYLSQITDAFGSLRNEEDLVDVTLSCEGRKIKAHKMLLSACSPYFREIFKENPCQHPVIVFRNVKFADLEAVVDYIYRGEVSVAQDQLESFLSTAELLEVKGFSPEPEEQQDNATHGNFNLKSRSRSPPLSPSSNRIQKKRKTHSKEDGKSKEIDPSPQITPFDLKQEVEDYEEDEEIPYEDDEVADPPYIAEDENSDMASSAVQDPLAPTGGTAGEGIDEATEGCVDDSTGLHIIEPKDLKPNVKELRAKFGRNVRTVQRLTKPRNFMTPRSVRKRVAMRTIRQRLTPGKRSFPKSPAAMKHDNVTVHQSGVKPVEVQSVEVSSRARSEDAKTPVGEETYSSQSMPLPQCPGDEPEMAEEAPELQTGSAPEEEVKEPEFDYYGCEVCKAEAKPCDRLSFTHKCPICPCMCFCAHLLKAHMRVIHGWFNVQRKFNHF